MSKDSNYHFNDPEFAPGKFNPLRPKLPPNMTFEEHLRIVEAGKKMIGIKASETPDLERLFNDAKQRIKVVRNYAAAIEGEHRMAGKDVDRKVFVEEIMGKYMDNFVHYGKDELCMILVQFLTEATVKELL